LRDGVGQRAADALEDRRAHEELPHVARLAQHDFVPQVVDEVAIVDREMREERPAVVRLPQRQRGEVEPGDPALRTMLQLRELLRRQVQAVPAGEQLGGFRVDRPDREGPGRVRVKPIEQDAHVERHDVAVLEEHLTRYAVNDHVVGRRADRRREPPVSLERRLSARGADAALGELVELARGDPGTKRVLEAIERVGDDLAGAPHRRELLRRLLVDHLDESFTELRRSGRTHCREIPRRPPLAACPWMRSSP
jgi:hypothetical protein